MFAFDLMRQLSMAGIEQAVASLRSQAGGLEYPAERIDLPTNRLGAAVRLDRQIRAWRPDVVQVHGGEALKWLAPSLLRPNGPAIVYRRIGMTPDWMAGSLRRGMHGVLIRRARVVVAVAEIAARQLIEDFRVPKAMVRIIGNAVDQTRVREVHSPVSLRRELGIRKESSLALFVGALTEEKNPLDLVEVAAEVCARVPWVVFAVAGTGPLIEEVERAVTAKGLQQRLFLLGARTDVPDLLRACDVLVLTSRTEGMPGVVIEAGLAGRPVAGYSVGGVPEIVIDGETGALAPSGEHRHLADLVVGLLTDPARLTRLGLEAKTRCEELFEMVPVAADYLALYREIGSCAAPALKHSNSGGSTHE